jgi:hypothetical protein
MSGPNNTISGGARRLIFVNTPPNNLFNKWTSSGIGATNASVRRAQKRRATSNPGELNKKGQLINYTQNCCPPELQRKSQGYYTIPDNTPQSSSENPFDPNDPLDPTTGEPQTDVEGFQIWYDGDRTGTEQYFQPTSVTNGSAITQWNDKSGTGHNANTNGGNGPILIEPWKTPPGTGYAGVNYDGTADYLVTSVSPGSDWFSNQQFMTIFMVIKTPTASPNDEMLITTNLGDITIRFKNTILPANNTIEVIMGDGTANITGVTPAASWTHDAYSLLTLVFDGTKTLNSNTLVLRTDKSTPLPISSSTNIPGLSLTYTVTGTKPTTTQDFGGPGAIGFGVIPKSNGAPISPGDPEYWGGEIAEALFYTNQFTQSGIGAIEDYLNTKWSLGF